MFDIFQEPEVWLSLATLTGMEIILGIDNIVFITILCARLPTELEARARRIGIGLALFSRLGLLLAISWVMELTQIIEMPWGPLVVVGTPLSGRNLILILGGIFLVAKASHEIYENTEKSHTDDVAIDKEDVDSKQVKREFIRILVQVVILDIVFSLDSVITAVGMVDHIVVMVVAMVIAVVVMMIFSNAVGDFVSENPSIRILALSFLVLIGTMLVMEGFGQHVSKGYIYAMMGFSLVVQLVNLRREKNVDRATLVADEA
jgi:predicted tellurium resistance membrane protein TerC